LFDNWQEKDHLKNSSYEKGRRRKEKKAKGKEGKRWRLKDALIPQMQ